MLTVEQALAMSSLAKTNRDQLCGGISVNGADPTICEVHMIAWDLCPFRLVNCIHEKTESRASRLGMMRYNPGTRRYEAPVLAYVQVCVRCGKELGDVTD